MFYNYNPKLKELSRENRKTGNLVEVLVWNCLKSKQLGYTFNRQKPIERYIVDFLCKELMLVIEIDGYSHGEKASYDENRDRELISLGYSILHFSNDDVLHNITGVIAHIKTWIDGAKE